MGQSIRLFIGMLLFIPQFIIALFVKLGTLFPDGTFSIHGASKLADVVVDEVVDAFKDEPTSTSSKPRTRQKK